MTTVPDLLRLLAVPVFGWAAWRDYRTRRLPGETWYPLVALAVVLLAWDAAVAMDAPAFERRLFLLRAAISVGFVVPIAYAFWWLGLFGAADRKAFVVLGLLFPTFPTYAVGDLTLPLVRTTLGVFSLTVLTDGVLVGAAYPAVTALRNATRGRFSPAMLVGRPVRWTAIPTVHGKLLETPDGFTRSGLDLDALRMYLRWRGIDLVDLRERPDGLRDPATLPDDPNPPTDGRVIAAERIEADGARDERTEIDGGRDAGIETGQWTDADDEGDDPWGAAAFLDDIEGSAYGTTPDGLRDGLDLLASRDAVWVSPGIPFLVAVFLGLLVALTYGDVLFGALRLVGIVP